MKQYMREVDVKLDENGSFDNTKQIDFVADGLQIEVVEVEASEHDEVKYKATELLDSTWYYEGFAEADIVNVNGDIVMGYYVVDANNRDIGSKTFVVTVEDEDGCQVIKCK